MKVNLVARGAPELPENFRYRVHVYEIYETAVDVNVSILEKRKKKILKFIPITTERVIASSTVHIKRDPQYDIASKRPLVEEAKVLYNYAKSRGKF